MTENSRDAFDEAGEALHKDALPGDPSACRVSPAIDCRVAHSAGSVGALEMAVAARPGEYHGDLDVRSGGGSQFTAFQYGLAIASLGLRQRCASCDEVNDRKLLRLVYERWEPAPRRWALAVGIMAGDGR